MRILTIICYVLFEWIEGIVRPLCVYMVST